MIFVSGLAPKTLIETVCWQVLCRTRCNYLPASSGSYGCFRSFESCALCLNVFLENGVRRQGLITTVIKSYTHHTACTKQSCGCYSVVCEAAQLLNRFQMLTSSKWTSLQHSHREALSFQTLVSSSSFTPSSSFGRGSFCIWSMMQRQGKQCTKIHTHIHTKLLFMAKKGPSEVQPLN